MLFLCLSQNNYPPLCKPKTHKFHHAYKQLHDKFEMLIHGNLKRVMKIIIEDNYEPNMVYICSEVYP
jgi:hypothetical protein